jgi:hypothetical protein
MPLGPEVMKMVIDSDFVNEVFRSIDIRLSDAKWVKECGASGIFVFEGSFTDGEKVMIVSEYIKAGWGKVIVSNSEDNGERPGLCSVRLIEQTS